MKDVYESVKDYREKHNITNEDQEGYFIVNAMDKFVKLEHALKNSHKNEAIQYLCDIVILAMITEPRITKTSRYDLHNLKTKITEYKSSIIRGDGVESLKEYSSRVIAECFNICEGLGCDFKTELLKKMKTRSRK